jgi:hypothetical protein
MNTLPNSDNPSFSPLLKKIFFIPYPYYDKNENATTYFDCFELSDICVDHVPKWLYDYCQYHNYLNISLLFCST